MNYQINKKSIVKKFKEFVDSKETKEDDYGKKKNKKSVSPLDKYEILSQFKYLYTWLLNKIKLDVRRMYIHNDAEFYQIYNKLQSHVNNKIRTNSQGQIYLSVNNNKIILYGKESEQEKYITANKNNLVNLFRSIVDEINSLLDGKLPADENRVMLRSAIELKNEQWKSEKISKINAENVAFNIINNIPEDIILSVHSCGKFNEFSNIFKEVYSDIIDSADEYERTAIKSFINKDNIEQIISDVRNQCAMSELRIKENDNEV